MSPPPLSRNVPEVNAGVYEPTIIFMENTMPHQKHQTIEAGTLYRVDAGDHAAMKGSVWFRGRVTDGSLILCVGMSN
jgi:hypothetical protein